MQLIGFFKYGETKQRCVYHVTVTNPSHLHTLPLDIKCICTTYLLDLKSTQIPRSRVPAIIDGQRLSFTFILTAQTSSMFDRSGAHRLFIPALQRCPPRLCWCWGSCCLLVSVFATAAALRGLGQPLQARRAQRGALVVGLHQLGYRGLIRTGGLQPGGGHLLRGDPRAGPGVFVA